MMLSLLCRLFLVLPCHLYFFASRAAEAAERRGSGAAEQSEGTKARSDLAVTCSRFFGGIIAIDR
jgi:hypothetical protein